jgi:hypothetical protein
MRVSTRADGFNSGRVYSFFFLSTDQQLQEAPFGSSSESLTKSREAAGIDEWIEAVEEAARKACQKHRISMALQHAQSQLAAGYR